MAKVKNLPAVTTLADDDVLYAVDDSVGTNGGRKIKKSDLKVDLAKTDAEIKIAYENNVNTNEFTDVEKAKLAGVEDGAEVNRSDADVKTAYENNPDTNAYTDAEKIKLGGLEPIAQVVVVQKSPSASQFGDIQTAIDSITDASLSKPYMVNIGPGIYNIFTPITLKPYVSLRGERISTVINQLDETKEVLIGAVNTTISQIFIQGSGTSGTDVSLVRYDGTDTSFKDFTLNNIGFGSCHTMVKVTSSPTKSPSMVMKSCYFSGLEFNNGFKLEGTGQGLLLVSSFILKTSSSGVSATDFISVKNSNSRVVLESCLFGLLGSAASTNFAKVEDGAEFDAKCVTIEGFDNGVTVPAGGTAPIVTMEGVLLKDISGNGIDVTHASTSGSITGTLVGAIVNSSSSLKIVNIPSHGSDHAEDGSDPIPNATPSVGGLFSATDKTKLSGVETGATQDQTGAEIKSAYEAEADTNAFTDSEKTDLASNSSHRSGDGSDHADVASNTSHRTAVNNPHKIPLLYAFGKENLSYLKIKTTTYFLHAQIPWSGTTRMGTPSSITIDHTIKPGDLGVITIQLRDGATGDVIVTKVLPAPTSEGVMDIGLDLGTLTGANFSSGRGIIEVHGLTSVNNEEGWISGIEINF